jgi:glucosamine--fructose-6-phosphate aminotransferase (isomerizing)
VSLFRAEIAEQPAVMRRLLDRSDAFSSIGSALRDRRPAGILIAARGSSDHAAVYAQYLFQQRNRLPVALAAPSLYTHYKAPPLVESFCVIGISQSGAAPDVIAVLADARRQGALTVAVSNDPQSPLAREADFVIPLLAGAECSVPASKTYSATLMSIALLSQAIDPEDDFGRALATVPEALERALACQAAAAEAARHLMAERMIVLGRGFNLATAQELALKVTETSYALARAWSAADFPHGPIALIEPGFPILVVEAASPTQEDTRRLAARLLEQGCTLLQLVDGTSPLPGASACLRIESGLPESLSPLPLAVAAQLLAAEVAGARGLDPDRPRSLNKITRTW